jgi:hypothetical protein
MERSDDYLDEFANDLSELAANRPDDYALVLDGSIEICPACRKLSAYAYCDTDEDETALDAVVSIGVCCGLGSWQCGHCRQYFAPAESILNAPCFTHSDD